MHRLLPYSQGLNNTHVQLARQSFVHVQCFVFVKWLLFGQCSVVVNFCSLNQCYVVVFSCAVVLCCVFEQCCEAKQFHLSFFKLYLYLFICHLIVCIYVIYLCHLFIYSY